MQTIDQIDNINKMIETTLQSYLNAVNLELFTPQASTQPLTRKKRKGCYYIFSSISQNDLPTYSDYKCFNNLRLKIDDYDLGCIYAGRSRTDVDRELQEHLLCTHTITQSHNNNLNTRILATGRIPLDGITQKQFNSLTGLGGPNKGESHFFKKVQDFKSVPQNLIKNLTKFPCVRMANGINVNESQWNGIKFAAIVIDLDKYCFLAQAFNYLFGQKYGQPPLNKIKL